MINMCCSAYCIMVSLVLVHTCDIIQFLTQLYCIVASLASRLRSCHILHLLAHFHCILVSVVWVHTCYNCAVLDTFVLWSNYWCNCRIEETSLKTFCCVIFIFHSGRTHPDLTFSPLLQSLFLVGSWQQVCTALPNSCRVSNTASHMVFPLCSSGHSELFGHVKISTKCP